MEFGLVFAVLGSTLAWSAFDAVRKRLSAHMDVAGLAFWVSAAQVPGYLVWMLAGTETRVNAAYWGPGCASLAANVLANLLFLESVRRGPLSVAIPVLSFTPVFTAVLGAPLLGETLSLPQWLGVVLVSGCALFLTSEPGDSHDPRRMIAVFFRSPGVVQMIGVAVLWAVTPICDKVSLRQTTVGFHGLFLSVGGAALMFLFLAARQRAGEIRISRRTGPLIFLGGFVSVLALGLQLVAISQMMVSVFEAIKRCLGVLLALCVGTLFFQERIPNRRIAAAVSMALGVALVLLD